MLKIADKHSLLKAVASGALIIALATGAWAGHHPPPPPPPPPHHDPLPPPPPPHQAPEVNPTILGIEGALAAAGVTVFVLNRRLSRKKELGRERVRI
jgi:hypothetical protein